MLVHILALALLLVLLLKWWSQTRQPCANFPPGPVGLPLVGHLPLLTAKDLVEGFSHLNRTYGKICSFNLGPMKRAVLIADFKILKECFRDDSTSKRPPFVNWFNKYFRFGNGEDARGLTFSEGEEWRQQRRFVLRTLRDFGFGKSGMEGLVREEIHELQQTMDEEVGQPVAMTSKFNISVINALWTIMAGERLSIRDERLLDIVSKMDRLNQSLTSQDLVNVFPPLRYIAPRMSGWTKMHDTLRGVFDFITPTIDEHIERFKPKEDEPQDLIDVYLNKILESSDNPASSFHGDLGLKNLRTCLFDLLIAGSETTSTALAWSILLLVNHPEVQARAQEELDRVVGEHRMPTLKDRSSLNYMEALVQEILRFSSIVPLGAPHCAVKDIEVCGYRIPQGTAIFANQYLICRNEEDFKDPDAFKPERFLSEEGVYVRNENNMVFGTGKRDCLGQTLAMVELYLFLACLLQRYEFKPLEEDQLPALEAKAFFTRVPLPCKVKFYKRH